MINNRGYPLFEVVYLPRHGESLITASDFG
jgi:hypothetical protein